MKTRLLLSTCLLGAQLIHAATLGTAFTYQGQLTDGGNPANGTYDLQFALYDAAAGGSVAGGPLTVEDVNVTDGIFMTALDFGSAFGADARWLEIGVRPGASTNAFTLLAGRQAVTPAPAALYAPTAGSADTAASATSASSVAWSGVTGVPAGFNDGVDNDTTYSAGTGLSLAGTIFSLDAAFTDGRYWTLGGNAGTTPGANFLGTTDDRPLELRVNNRPALLITTTRSNNTFNVVGGSPVNSVDPDVMAATVSGGGTPELFGGPRPNSVASDFATVGGGADNRVGTNSNSGVIAGGFGNRIRANSFDVTIGGGAFNVASNANVTIGGGGQNLAVGLTATIAGGFQNRALETDATIGGGYTNVASGYRSTIGGGALNVASAPSTTVSGGQQNIASGLTATIAGGFQNRALETDATVGGGYTNTASGYRSTVGGGAFNEATNQYAVVAGGNANRAYGDTAVIGGGVLNLVTNVLGVIGGGAANIAGGFLSTVGGGQGNLALANNSTIVGGLFNTNIGVLGFIGGGMSNQVSGLSATVGGGELNRISGDWSTLGGGAQNLAHGHYGVVAGGQGNTANIGSHIAIGGGGQNSASGSFATVPGGFQNVASLPFSFAAGNRAKANHAGAFVWADSTAADFASTTADQFNVRASGGVRFVTGGAGVMVDGSPVLAGPVGTGQIADGAVTTLKLADGAVTSPKLAPDIDLGSASVNGSLDVFRAASGAPSISLLGSAAQISTFGGDGLEQIRLWGPSWGELLLNDNAGNDTTVFLTATSDSGGEVHARSSTGAARAILDGGGTHGGGELRLYNTSASQRLTLYGSAPDTDTPSTNSAAGGIDLFEADGTRTIALRGEQDDALVGPRSVLKMYNSLGTNTVLIGGQQGTLGGVLTLGHTDGDAGVTMHAGSSGGNIRVWSDTQVAEIHIQGGTGLNNGRIGINRVPAANALEVDGAASKSVAGDWLANSDRRIKKDIRPLTNALEVINRVRPVAFRYDEDYRREHPSIRDVEYYNVVAQEFAKVFPDSVQKGGDTLAGGDPILQVDTYPATIYSISAIQELDRKLTEKDAQIRTLEKRLAELEARLSRQ